MSSSVPSHENALSTEAFCRLYVGACRIDNPRRRLLACYIILLTGRLGLRIAELQHLREAWINWERGSIRIPKRDPCGCRRCWIQAYDKWGRNGLSELLEAGEWDGPTSWKHCKADQRREIIEAADCCTPDTLVSIVTDEQFRPKYDRSARTISFGWSERLTCVLITFFDEHDCLEHTQQSINNIITAAAENAPGIDPEHLSAHNLRATGLTFLADNLIKTKVLGDHAGWKDITTAEKYLRQSGRINTVKLYNIMGRAEDAPPVVPEEPDSTYPVLMNPTPFQGEPVDPIGPGGQTYDADVRRQRAEESRDSPLKVRHPREVNIPTGRAGMPTKPELQFDITDGDLPGHIDPSSDRYDAKESAVETTATTLSTFADPHSLERTGDEVAQQWRKESLQQRVSDHSQDERPRSVIPGLSVGVEYVTTASRWMSNRLQREWDSAIATEGPPRPLHEQLMGASVACVFLTALAITMANNGIAIDPFSQEVSLPPIPSVALLFGSAIGIGQVLWSDYCIRVADRQPYPRLAALLDGLSSHSQQ
jgi:hypothetical protein